MRMKVVVIGCRGMLGSDLMEAGRAAGFEMEGWDLPELDIRDFNAVREKIPACDWVVNVAAYTRVDDAEREREAAFAVNAEGALNVARVCGRRNVPLLHISTDYVFDGRKGRPYVESDPPEPLGVYGASKLAGEKAVRAEGGRFLIVRTQSLFGRRGPNFVRAVAEKIQKGAMPLRVVNDQVSSPTYTRHLAAALLRLIRLGKQGVVHVSASGSCSWFEFAKAIVARIRPQVEVVPISSRELARPAQRPAYSVLDNGLYISWTGAPLPSWQEGLDAYLTEEGWL
jgi:dTDP-4-dehydrorhamnose reductase